jgi:hypothetical protein
VPARTAGQAALARRDRAHAPRPPAGPTRARARRGRQRRRDGRWSMRRGLQRYRLGRARGRGWRPGASEATLEEMNGGRPAECPEATGLGSVVVLLEDFQGALEKVAPSVSTVQRQKTATFTVRAGAFVRYCTTKLIHIQIQYALYGDATPNTEIVILRVNTRHINRSGAPFPWPYPPPATIIVPSPPSAPPPYHPKWRYYATPVPLVRTYVRLERLESLTAPVRVSTSVSNLQKSTQPGQY